MSGRSTTCRCFEIGEVRVSLATDCPRVLEDFASLYHACPDDSTSGGSLIRIEVTRRGRTLLGRRRYCIRSEGKELSLAEGIDEVLPRLEWGINQRVIDSRAEYLQLHAATLVHEGRGVVLAGHSESGKSTLSAALLARGWQYLCDEFALIHPRTLHVHPYPKAVCLKAGSFPVIERLGLPVSRRRTYLKSWKGGVRYVTPTAVRETAIGAPSPIRFVIFPSWSGGDRPRLSRVRRARAVFRLAGLTLNQHVYGAHTISLLGDAVRGAECYALESGRIEETCDLLTARITRCPRRQEPQGISALPS